MTPLLVNDEDLMSTGSLSVTVNPLCRETSHLVMVTFGVQRSDGGGCEERGNVTQSLSSGESATFSTDITLRPDEKYCYEVNEQPGEYIICSYIQAQFYHLYRCSCI